jgi:esterase/lipase superfamily enzyme
LKIDYYKWFSHNLGHDIEIKVYGYYGKPVLVFPAQAGRFFDFENFGMVEAIQDFIESGKIKLFTVDSIDSQSWANRGIHPADRALRHEDYDRYIIQEVAPFIRTLSGNTQQKFLTTGCSMGAYHAVNFFFRHPDEFDAVIALSGLYQLDMFVGDYMDDNIYFNSPLNYLQNMKDLWYLERYRQSDIIICSGQGAWEDAMLADSVAMKNVLERLEVPAWIDIWGHDVNHDWPWWQKMLPYFLSSLDLKGYPAN